MTHANIYVKVSAVLTNIETIQGSNLGWFGSRKELKVSLSKDKHPDLKPKKSSAMRIDEIFALLTVVFIAVVLVGHVAINKMQDADIILSKAFSVFFVVICIGYLLFLLHIYLPEKYAQVYQSASFGKEGRLANIVDLTNVLNVRIWKPVHKSTFGKEIIFNDLDDGKIYTLHGVQFEDGYSEEKFLSSTNGHFILYLKGTNKMFGPVNAFAETN